MRIPLRFRLINAYLASLISPAGDRGRPPFGELLRSLVQKGKVDRVKPYVSGFQRDDSGRTEVKLLPFDRDFLYPAGLDLGDLYGSIEMCFDQSHWHSYWRDQWRPGQGDLVVDCGVAEGIFSYDVARLGADVVGFEPMEFFREVLTENLAGVDNVRILPKAAGAESGYVCFEERGAGSSISADGVQTELSTIDAELFELGREVTMIKADVEGFEYDVLLGAQQVIKRDSPRLAITVYHHENNVPQIEGLLSRLNSRYRIACRGLAPNGHPVMLHAWCE